MKSRSALSIITFQQRQNRIIGRRNWGQFRIAPLVFRSISTTTTKTWESFQESHGSKIRELPEVRAVQNLLQFLESRGNTMSHDADNDDSGNYKHMLTRSQHRLALDAAMATFSLHTHARIASLVGKGYYTIGPCGEELLSGAALALQSHDTTALHYRHTGMSLARQLMSMEIQGKDQPQQEEFLQQLLLDQARGYTTSKNDPVTGGVHRCIGAAAANQNEYLVTSTLVRTHITR
eukprot:scaffold7641_cov115-Cylindrotheca_fusiformis.AAC.9